MFCYSIGCTAICHSIYMLGVKIHGKLQDELYLYLYHCSLSCRPLYCMQRFHLCCYWLRIPECCPSICSHCVLLYVEPPPWGVWARSVFWRGHRETLKFFKVVSGHYYEEIWYNLLPAVGLTPGGSINNQTGSYPLCLVLILRTPPVPISWLQEAAWIVASVSLYNVLLIFFYYILFWPLILIV